MLNEVLEAFTSTVLSYLSDGSKIIPKITEIITQIWQHKWSNKADYQREGTVAFYFSPRLRYLRLSHI